jgi:translation elongation factor EF-Tu-like GTPase
MVNVLFYDSNLKRKKSNQMYDIKVEITVIPTSSGGRKNPFSNGFRPEFNYDGVNCIVALSTTEGVEWVYPGETVLAYIVFTNPHRHVGKIYPGKEFTLNEGDRVIANGKIVEILELENAGKRRS